MHFQMTIHVYLAVVTRLTSNRNKNIQECVCYDNDIPINSEIILQNLIHPIIEVESSINNTSKT